MPAIRPMQPRDADAVRELMRQLCGVAMTRGDMLERLDFVTASPFDWLFVCEVDNAVVVDTNARHQGIGRVLMAYAEAFARQHDCIGTWLVSGFKRADEAHQFYADLGYATTGYRFVKKFSD